MSSRALSRSCGVSLVLCVGLSACAHAGASRNGAAGANTPGEVAVRAARTRFNAAIARRDTATIASVLLPSYDIVTGRSVQRHGREAAMGMWASAMRDTTMGYVRTTRAVRVNEGWGLAQELGEWTGYVTAADGPARSSGVYAAKWQRAADGAWRLQAEVFTTLACDGGPLGCPRPEPVVP